MKIVIQVITTNKKWELGGLYFQTLEIGYSLAFKIKSSQLPFVIGRNSHFASKKKHILYILFKTKYFQLIYLITECVLGYRVGRRISKHRKDTQDINKFIDISTFDPLLPDSKKYL